MKILFTMGSPEYLRYFDETIRLLAARGHSVAIAVNSQKDQKPVRLDAVAGETGQVVSMGLVPRRRDAWTDLAKVVRGTMDFARYLDPRFADAPALRARIKRKALPPALHGLDRLRSLGQHRLERLLRVLSAIERAIPSSPAIEAFIREVSPDAVLVSPLVDAASDQVDTIKSARALGIPTAACIASWDNLTNKGLLRVRPDRVILWNAMQKAEAVTLHGIPPERVVMTGAQPFDRWFGKQPGRARHEFSTRVGLPSAEPFLLFVGSSMFISAADAEIGFVRRWLQAIRASTDPVLRDVPVLVRPHPYNGGAWADVDLSEFGRTAVWPRGRHNPVDDANREDYFESLHYSLAVVGINTSAMIEAAIVGRPVLSLIGSDFSRTQEGTLHFHYLLPENGGFLRVASSLDEHLRQLAETIQDPERVRAQIERFVGSFIRPQGTGLPSVPMLADAIEAVARLPRAASTGAGLSSVVARTAIYPLTPLATLARSKQTGSDFVRRHIVRPTREGTVSLRKAGRRAYRHGLLAGAQRVGRATRAMGRAVERRVAHLARQAASRLRRARYRIAVAIKGHERVG
jgi:hypothetical protein